MPAIVKPASQTAFLAELMFRDMIESDILPPGSLQLICGSVGDLFEHLTCQDTIAFTVSIQTAEFLQQHPDIERVNYPGLPTHPGHDRARELFDGFSGMLSFETAGGVESAERFMAAARIPVIAPSLGGVETLLTRPALTSHSGLTAEERRQAGISDSLIRVSVGIEHTEDLLEDFQQALTT